MKATPLSRLFLALFLFFALAADISASPAPVRTTQSEPTVVQAAWFDFVPVSTTSDRRSVVRIAGVAMFLGLVIMYWKKH